MYHTAKYEEHLRINKCEEMRETVTVLLENAYKTYLVVLKTLVAINAISYKIGGIDRLREIAHSDSRAQNIVEHIDETIREKERIFAHYNDLCDAAETGDPLKVLEISRGFQLQKERILFGSFLFVSY